jgi:NADPH2:quinone reductase
MKAVVCRRFGPPENLVVEEVPRRKLGAGQVRIAVHAAGVNFSDVLMIQGLDEFKPPVPFIPGSEVAGEVIETTPDVDALRIGDRVMATLPTGGYADEAVIAAHSCIVLPRRMNYVTAAGFSTTYGMSFYALVQRADLKSGDLLLVHGAAGGAGGAALDIGRNLGAKLIATGSHDHELERVAQHAGVRHVLNHRTDPNWTQRVKELTLAQGVDVIFDPYGGALLEQSLGCVAWDGRVLLVGFAGSDIPRIAPKLVRQKSATLLGVYWSAWLARNHKKNRQNFETMFRWYGGGKLKPPVSHTFPLAQAKYALRASMHGQALGKCVLLTAPARIPPGAAGRRALG